MTRAEIIAEFDNSVEGELNLEDGINCELCKNRGFITIPIDDVHTQIKNCECMQERNTLKHLNNCGITKSVLEQLNFDTYTTNKTWQQKLLSICKAYTEEIINGNKYWLLLSGQSGSGKTHLCTSVFQEIIKKAHLRGMYMLWNTEIPKLCNLRRSSFTDNQEEYEYLVKQYKEVNVLYIDDLFKLDARLKEDGLSLAYDILNYRYMNEKITIISTETTKEQFRQLDVAICGRCYEMSDKRFWINLDGAEKNYRFKGE